MAGPAGYDPARHGPNEVMVPRQAPAAIWGPLLFVVATFAVLFLSSILPAAKECVQKWWLARKRRALLEGAAAATTPYRSAKDVQHGKENARRPKQSKNSKQSKKKKPEASAMPAKKRGTVAADTAKKDRGATVQPPTLAGGQSLELDDADEWITVGAKLLPVERAPALAPAPVAPAEAPPSRGKEKQEAEVSAKAGASIVGASSGAVPATAGKQVKMGKAEPAGSSSSSSRARQTARTPKSVPAPAKRESSGMVLSLNELPQPSVEQREAVQGLWVGQWETAPSDPAGLPMALPTHQNSDSAAAVVGVAEAAVMRGKDLRTLRPGCWLNDEAMNGSLGLLCAAAGGTGNQGVFSFSTFFFARLCSNKVGYDYAGVRRWSKAVDIFGQWMTIFPINHDNNHWSLAAMAPQDDIVTLFHFDSMASPERSKHVLSKLKRYVADEWADKKAKAGTPGPQEPCPSIATVPANTIARLPQQNDSSSCGVFVLAYTYLLLHMHRRLPPVVGPTEGRAQPVSASGKELVDSFRVWVAAALAGSAVWAEQ